ncbi:MAG: hypothetical protein JSR82_02830 [Verrucomicrobia bacterium]|nr:hypothetical protein [Verrucomicrobiota bacterium]
MPRSLALFSLCAALALAACSREKITLENAALLQPGMPAERVPEVLGDRNVGIASGAISKTFTYHTDQLRIMVETRRGKITQVRTRDLSRKIANPARKDLPVLQLSFDGTRASTDAALQQGGPAALAEWVRRELVPGRPIRTSDGRELIVGDRVLAPLDADGFPDYERALVKSETDEPIWYTTFTSVLVMNWNDRQPALSLLVLAAR